MPFEDALGVLVLLILMGSIAIYAGWSREPD